MGAIGDRDPAPRRYNPGDGQDSSCVSVACFTPPRHLTSRHRLSPPVTAGQGAHKPTPSRRCGRWLTVQHESADAIAYAAEAYSKQTGRQPDHTPNELSSECAFV